MQNIISSSQFKLNFWKISLITICTCSAIYGLLITTDHYLDDTFTHLRIARNLMENGFYSFNGIFRDFSTSSPLYTAILSIGLRFWDSPYLAKFTSLIFYYSVYIFTSIYLLKTQNLKALISSIFLIGISSPFGVRWLTDGMETSLIMLFSIILAYNFESILRINDNENKTINYYFSYFICTFSILLRIEFIFIIVWFIIVYIISNVFLQDRFDYRNLFLRTIPFILSVITSFGFLYINFGSFTPDTSIAKAGVKYNISYFITSILRPHFGASLFGISLAISLLLSFYLIYVNKISLNNKNLNSFSYLINFSFPLMLILIFFKGQMIQGIRYLVFLETFLISFNLLTSKNYDLSGFVNKRTYYKYLSLFLVPLILSPWLWNDFKVLKKISKGRSESFINLSNRDFKCLRNKNLISIDFGMISYFSKAFILDPSGLVNGRDLAKLNMDERMNEFLKNKNIHYAFLNDEQIEELKGYLNLRDWETIGSYKFPNFGKNSDDIHYLLKSPEIEKCKTALQI